MYTSPCVPMSRSVSDRLHTSSTGAGGYLPRLVLFAPLPKSPCRIMRKR